MGVSQVCRYRLLTLLQRNAIRKQWGTLLQIAENVKNGKRIDHQNAIEEKRELYGWVEGRARVMIDNIEKD
jgi:hypothetical protein